MAQFRFSGGARPSKPMSWLAAVVGIGMLLCAGSLLFSPVVAGSGFLLLWLGVVVALVVYHVRNAMSPEGVPHTTFGFEGAGDGGPTEQRSHAERLRELERLRADGLVNDDEYRRKRADILGEDW